MIGSRFLLAGALALGACRPAPAPMPDVFPEMLGVWRRTAVQEPAPPAGAERIRAASYEGPGKLDARVYQLPTPAAALDMAQRWKPAPDTVFFYTGRFFVLIQWKSADRKALHDFVAALEKKFPATK